MWSLSLGLGTEPSSAEWEELPNLLEGRHSHSCFHHDGKVRDLLHLFYKRGRLMQKYIWAMPDAYTKKMVLYEVDQLSYVDIIG